MLRLRGALRAAGRGWGSAPSSSSSRSSSSSSSSGGGEGGGEGGGAGGEAEDRGQTLDAALLDLLVCPLSKKPLRYEKSSRELVNEELGIAYPVVDGVPDLTPRAARPAPRPPARP